MALLIMMPFYSQSQCNFHKRDPIIEVGIGRSLFSVDTKNSSNVDLHASFILYNFYLSVGSNFERGYGGDITDETKPAYDPHRIRLYTMDMGYLFKINDMFRVGPLVGLSIGKEIYMSSKNSFDSKSYYFGDNRKYYNFGVMGTLTGIDYEWVKLYVGVGTTEIIKAGIVITILSN